MPEPKLKLSTIISRLFFLKELKLQHVPTHWATVFSVHRELHNFDRTISLGCPLCAPKPKPNQVTSSRQLSSCDSERMRCERACTLAVYALQLFVAPWQAALGLENCIITPVFKKGDEALIANYHTISPLSPVSKLCERYRTFTRWFRERQILCYPAITS